MERKITFRTLAALPVCLAAAAYTSAAAADLGNLPANTWVPIKYTGDQLAGGAPDEKGSWGPQGWNRLVYDSAGKRALFYDRWQDKKHGGWTIYGNCLFAFDPVMGKVTPLKVVNWVKYEKGATYGETELPENAKEPTPGPRHVLDAFEFVPDLNAVFICNGLNQGATKDGKVIGSDLLQDTWRLDIEKQTWTQIKSAQHPRISSTTAMSYCADTKSMVYVSERQIWILDLAAGQWRKSKAGVPTGGFGQTIAYDPPRKRMLIKGGITAAFDVTPPAGGYKDPTCQKLYAFDPKTETVTPLADCPTPQWFTPQSYDSKRDIFVVANVMKDWGKDTAKQYPSGVFSYDPKKDAWTEVKTTNPTPSCNSWWGWIQLCYDPDRDCHLGMAYNSNPPPGSPTNREFYAIRYVP
jgi:hypothetical protein